MFNLIPDSRVQNVLSLINGLVKWVDNNTGDTYDGRTDHFIINNQGVLNNNRHWTGDSTRMQGIYNGNSTTEGQTIHILGYLHIYLATRDKKYLDTAEMLAEAHIEYFHDGVQPPDTPQRWPCNWVVNGKEPVPANYPINPDAATQGGFKCVPVRITNGVGQVPHGAPFWGEYMDVIMYAHRGAMAWESINASTQRYKEDIDGQIDWDAVLENVNTVTDTPWSSKVWVNWDAVLGKTPETVWGSANRAPQLKMSTVNVRTGWKVGIGKGPADQSWSGKELEEVPFSEIGKFELEDKSVNGVYFVNYATANPVEHGGYLVGRNEMWHNRPIMTPFINNRFYQMGDASDAQVWLVDCFYMLWRITGKDRYKKALESTFYTAHEYTYMDLDARFFRRGEGLSTPFTDGTSYEYTSGSAMTPEFDRDENGYITATFQPGRLYMEQQSVLFRISDQSTLITEVGDYTLHAPSDKKPEAYATLSISPEKLMAPGESAKDYKAPFDLSTGIRHEVNLNELVESKNPATGDIFLTTDARAFVHNDVTTTSIIMSGILGNIRDFVSHVQFPDDDAQLIYGFWLLDDSHVIVDSVTYSSDQPVKLSLRDADGWKWYWTLPATDGWQTVNLSLSDCVLASWQSNDGDWFPYPGSGPGRPNSFVGDGKVDQVDFSPVSNDLLPQSFYFYCINQVPGTFSGNDGWTQYFTLVMGNADVDVTFKIGDCYIKNPRLDSVRYTPGVIPFSNSYITGSSQIGDWRGLPYPGYQWPMMYCIQKNHDWYQVWLQNQIDFIYDAQVAYTEKWGEVGPEAAAYIWNRPDAIAYGPPDTWTFYHWGDQAPWAGYHPRTYMAAARAWYELFLRGRPVPQKLKDYVTNWTNWLKKYVERWGNLPTSFPSEKNAYDTPPNPINSHQTGLWLAGASYSLLSGAAPEAPEYVAQACITELIEHRDIIPHEKPGYIMSGAWSPWADPNGTDGMAYGFHTGELLRGMGLYAIYLRRGQGYDMFDGVKLSATQASLDLITIES